MIPFMERNYLEVGGFLQLVCLLFFGDLVAGPSVIPFLWEF